MLFERQLRGFARRRVSGCRAARPERSCLRTTTDGSNGGLIDVKRLTWWAPRFERVREAEPRPEPNPHA